MQNTRRLLSFIVIVITIVGLVSCGSSASNTGTTAPPTSSSGNTPTTAPTQHFKVGVPVKVGDTFIVTLNSAKTNPGSEFSMPKAGNIYLVIDVTLKNVSAIEQNVSSVLQFTLQDATGQKYDQTFADFAKASPDGKVVPNSLLRGELVYEVPKALYDFTFSFEADITSPGQTIWDIHV